MNKITFKVDDIEYAVVKPNPSQVSKGKQILNKEWAEGLRNGLILRQALEYELERQGIWNDSLQKQYKDLREIVMNGTVKLEEGGIKLSEAKQIALDVAKARSEMNNLLTRRIEMENNTCEGQAQNAQFMYFVSVCLVYNDTGKPVYKSVDEMLENQDKECVIMGAEKLMTLLYGVDSDYAKSLPENVFLTEYGLNDEVSSDDEDEEEVVVEKKPFLDEEGKPIVLEKTTNEK